MRDEQTALTPNESVQAEFVDYEGCIVAVGIKSKLRALQSFFYIALSLVASHEIGMRDKRNKFESMKRDQPIQFRIFVLLFGRFESHNFALIGSGDAPIELDANGVFSTLFALANVDVSADGCWRAGGGSVIGGRPWLDVFDRRCV